MNWTFWYTWPSLLVEFISGVVTNFGARLVLLFLMFTFPIGDINTVLGRMIVSVGASLIYEIFVDKHHDGWTTNAFAGRLKDVLQRMIGIVVAEFLFDVLKVLT